MSRSNFALNKIVPRNIVSIRKRWDAERNSPQVLIITASEQSEDAITSRLVSKHHIDVIG